MWVLFYLLLLLVFSLGLIKSTHWLVDGVRYLVNVTGVSAYGLTSFVLAFSTSLPELTVAISAGAHGSSSLVLGNVLGSNIANISLILGLAAAAAGSLRAYDSFLRREVFYGFIAGSLPLLLMVDGKLGEWEGVFLIAVYGLYNLTVLARNRKQLSIHEAHAMPLYRRLWSRLVSHEFGGSVMKLIAGTAGLLISAELLVRAAIEMAVYVELPILLVGLFVVAVGTSLPELAFELVAIREGDAQMGFGNILGSIVANSTLILGLSAVVSPIDLSESMIYFWYTSAAFVISFFVFWMFVWTKHALERIEGIVLVFLYCLFVLLQLS